MQSQIITVSSQNVNSSGGATGKMSGEPFVTHRLIMGKEKISGEDDFTIIDDWSNELDTDLEIIVLGSKIIMKEAERMKHVIDESAMLRHPRSAMVTKLNRQLYAILSKKKTSDSKAKFELNGLTEESGA